MENPLIIHGLSMHFPRISHGESMDNPWIIHGLSMANLGYPWFLDIFLVSSLILSRPHVLAKLLTFEAHSPFAFAFLTINLLLESVRLRLCNLTFGTSSLLCLFTWPDSPSQDLLLRATFRLRLLVTPNFQQPLAF